MHLTTDLKLNIVLRDFIAYRNGSRNGHSNVEKTKPDRMFMSVFFHNKGIEMIDLPKILQREPPIVSYSYTKPIYNIMGEHA